MRTLGLASAVKRGLPPPGINSHIRQCFPYMTSVRLYYDHIWLFMPGGGRPFFTALAKPGVRIFNEKLNLCMLCGIGVRGEGTRGATPPPPISTEMEVFRAIFAEAFGQFVGQGEISVWATMPPPPRSKNFSDEIVFAPPKNFYARTPM